MFQFFSLYFLSLVHGTHFLKINYLLHSNSFQRELNYFPGPGVAKAKTTKFSAKTAIFFENQLISWSFPLAWACKKPVRCLKGKKKKQLNEIKLKWLIKKEEELPYFAW